MAVRTIATDIKLTGEKAFNDQMKAVNSNLKTLKSDMAAVSAEFSGNADSSDALAAKQKILQDIVDQQKVKVEALRESYKQVSEIYGENSAQADNMKQQLNYATASLSKETAALEKNAEAMNRVGEKEFETRLQDIDRSIKTLGSDLAVVTAEYEGNADSSEALAAKQKILHSIVDQHNAKVSELREKYTQVAEAYGENSAQADNWKQQLNSATVALTKETAALQKNSDALRKAQKEEQTYTPITQKAASAVKGFGDKIKSTVARAKEGAHHVPGLSEALDVAGVAAKGAKAGINAAGTAVKALGSAAATTAKGVGTASASIAKGFGNIATGATKGLAVATTAAATLGTAALTTMVSFAKQSAEAAQAAKDAGEKLSESQQKWLDYSESLNGLDASVASAKIALGGILLPMLGELSTQGAQFLNDFAAEMEAAGTDTKAQTQVMTDYIVKGVTMIKDQLPQYIDAAKEILGGLAKGLGDASPELIDMGLDLVLELVDSVTSASPAMAEGAVDLLNKLISGLSSRAPELTKAALGMVKALLAGLSQNGPSMMEGAKELVSALVQGLHDEGPELLDTMFDMLMDLLDGIIDYAPQMGEGAIHLVESLIQGLIEKGPDLLTSAVRMVTDLVRGLAQGAPDIIPAAANLVVTLITALVEAAPDLLLAGLELIYGIISGLIDGLGIIFNAAGDIINTLIDAFAAKGEDFVKIGSEIIQKIKDGIKKAWDGLVSWFIDLWDSLFKDRDVNVNVNKSTSGTSSVSGFSATAFSSGSYDDLTNKLRNFNRELADSIDTSFDIPPFGGNRPTGRYYTTRQGNVINLYFTAKQITQADIEMICDTVNRKLGDAM